MLANRVFNPASDEIIYHYCSAVAFKDIIESGKIRFSDANLMNDVAESQYGYKIFEEGASKLLNLVDKIPELKGFDEKFLDNMDDCIGPSQLTTHPFLACFSRDGDLLSQWRGYADDATGFAIGFSAIEMRKLLPAMFLEVCYDKEKQVDEMAAAIMACYKENEQEKRKFGRKFIETCSLLSATMYALKSPAFVEEKEIRAVHAVKVEINENRWLLTDEGGVVDGKNIGGESIKFRVKNGAIASYLDIPFRRESAHQPIRRIVLGPKNENGPGNVNYLLGANGYGKVELAESAATYR